MSKSSPLHPTKRDLIERCQICRDGPIRDQAQRSKQLVRCNPSTEVRYNHNARRTSSRIILAIAPAQLLDPAGAALQVPMGGPLPSGAPTTAAHRWASAFARPANRMPAPDCALGCHFVRLRRRPRFDHVRGRVQSFHILREDHRLVIDEGARVE